MASFKGVNAVMRRPAYIVLALLIGIMLLGVMLWLFNLNLLGYIFFGSDLAFVEKVQFVVNGYGGLFTNFHSPAAASMALLVVLMAINFCLLIFVLKHRGQEKIKNSGKSGLALVAATIGSGCAVCGTGLLGPVLAATGAAGSVGLVKIIGVGANLVGMVLVTYSIYGLGQQAAAVVAKEKF